VIGQEEMASSCTSGGYWEKISSPKVRQPVQMLDREVVESPSLEVFRRCVDVVLGGHSLVVDLAVLG